MGEDFAGDVALEAAHDLGLGLALGSAASHVVPGGLVAAHADQGDAPQGAVGLPVAAAVQPVPVSPPGGDRDRGGSGVRACMTPRALARSGSPGGWQAESASAIAAERQVKASCSRRDVAG